MAAVALRMPSHYVPVEAEEMEYVEGGEIIRFTLDAQTCGEIAAGASFAVYLAQFIPGLGVIFSGIFALGSTMYWIASEHNGIEYTVLKLGPICTCLDCRIIW